MRFAAMERTLGGARDELFTRAHEVGVEGIELEVHEDAPPLAEQSGATGVQVASVICGGEGLDSAEPAERAAARERLQIALADAARLGSDAVLLPYFELRDLADPAATDRFIEDVRSVLPEAEARGVVIAWESALPAAELRQVIEAVGSPRFRCCFDFANAAKRGPDPAEEIRSLRELIVRVHAKNLNKQPLHAAGVDLLACLAALREIGYDGWIALETPPGDEPVENARRNLSFLSTAWMILPRSL